MIKLTYLQNGVTNSIDFNGIKETIVFVAMQNITEHNLVSITNLDNLKTCDKCCNCCDDEDEEALPYVRVTHIEKDCNEVIVEVEDSNYDTDEITFDRDDLVEIVRKGYSYGLEEAEYQDTCFIKASRLEEDDIVIR